MIKRSLKKMILLAIVLLPCYVHAEDTAIIRNKNIEKSGIASGVQNLWISQDVRGQSDVFTNDTKEIVYYACFKNLTNVNLFQEKLYTIEWIDPKGEVWC